MAARAAFCKQIGHGGSFFQLVGGKLIGMGQSLDGKEDSVAGIDAPQALRLAREPQPNVERYDALLGKDLRHAS